MSAKTGFEGDTLACQIAVAANPGNSGAPVLNRNGEVIGVLSTRQIQAQGVVFAIRSKNIFKMLDEIKMIKGDSAISSIKIQTVSAIKGLDRVQQIKKNRRLHFYSEELLACCESRCAIDADPHDKHAVSNIYLKPFGIFVSPYSISRDCEDIHQLR